MITTGRRSIFFAVLVLGITGARGEDPDARALVESMSNAIENLAAFTVEGDAYTDARLDPGLIIEHSSHVTLRLRRDPGSIHITNRGAENTRDVYFDDGAVNVYSTADNFYAQAEIPQGVESMLEFAVDDLGIESPMLDLIAADVAKHLLTDAQDIQYLGLSLIRERVYHHVGIRYPETDVQVWIASEGRPLPGKLAISSKWEGGAPRFVGFFEWNTKPQFAADTFTFSPPDGAVRIDFADRLPH